MIIRAALLTYRDGSLKDQLRDLKIIELECVAGVFPERIEVFPSKPYYLLKDRDRLAHRETYEAFRAVYLLDFEKLKAQA